LNTSAAADSRDDYDPQVSTDSVGNWIAVWSSEDSLGATIGTDEDILFATLSEMPADLWPPTSFGTSDSGDPQRPTVDWEDVHGATSYNVWLINLKTGAFVQSAATDTMVYRSRQSERHLRRRPSDYRFLHPRFRSG
jgi:hypothetical protein